VEGAVVYDARKGLERQALSELRAAERVVVGSKDANTAAVGYWVGASGAAGEAGESLHVVLFRQKETARASQRMIQIKGTALAAHWKRFFGGVRVGDVLTLETRDIRRIRLRLGEEGGMFASLTLWQPPVASGVTVPRGGPGSRTCAGSRIGAGRRG
jgi:hypothetical protein